MAIIRPGSPVTTTDVNITSSTLAINMSCQDCRIAATDRTGRF